MITAQHILEALVENRPCIQAALGPEDWARFCGEIAPLQRGFADMAHRDALEAAADPVWQVCRRYAFVRERILEHSAQAQRKLAAGDYGGEQVPVREIANRFQSLLADLAEAEPVADSEPR